MEKIEGGIIQQSFPFPARKNSFLVAGKWTDFYWQKDQEINLNQFRDGTLQRKWRWTGYQTLSRVTHQDSLLILTSLTPLTISDLSLFKPGDLIVLGEGGKYSEFVIEATDLTANRDCAIELEVEKHRYKAIALYEQGKFSRMVVFHLENLKLAPSKECVVWRRGKPFSVRLGVGENNIYPKNKKANPIQTESPKNYKIFYPTSNQTAYIAK
jgi:hypothetical protein